MKRAAWILSLLYVACVGSDPVVFPPADEDDGDAGRVEGDATPNERDARTDDADGSGGADGADSAPDADVSDSALDADAPVDAGFDVSVDSGVGTCMCPAGGGTPPLECLEAAGRLLVTMTASSESPGYPSGLLNDDDACTSWFSNGGCMRPEPSAPSVCANEWVTARLNKPGSVARIRLRPVRSPDTSVDKGFDPIDIEIVIKDDRDGSLSPTISKTLPRPATDNEVIFEPAVADVSTIEVRIKTALQGTVGIGELEVFAR